MTIAANSITTTDAIAPDNEKYTSTYSSCANDPDFAIICAFLQKFSTDLQIEHFNFKQLQEWLSDTNEGKFNGRSIKLSYL